MCLSNGSEDELDDKEYMKPEINVSGDETEMVAQLQRYITERLIALLDHNGTVGIGVSGGSMPPVFCKALFAVAPEHLNWKRIRIFMVDERNVDKDDEDSNIGAYMKLFPSELHHVLIPVPINKDPVVTAQNYEVNLRKYLLPEQMNNHPRFDMVFLGCGPDGHTASIFTGRDRLEKFTDLHWVSAITDSPKPPPARVTLTMPCFHWAKNLAFIITGAQKAPIVRAIHNRDLQYPAAQARPFNDKLTLFLDEDAARGIPDRDETSESESPPPFD